MAMLRATLYCRLSKDDMLQGDSESIKTQKVICQGFSPQKHILKDKGLSPSWLL